MDGTEGLSARRVRRFAEELARCIEVPVQMLDERWTTVEAHARLRETGAKQKETRSKIDSASAAILLQSYLDGLATRHDA
jgi:putative Holliday junction resolvase